MTVYHANAIFRNAKGREVSYRVPLWSGEAADIAGAMAAARNAAKASDAMTADVDTVVIKLKGPKDSLVTATEYAEDLRSGEGSSADQTTLLNDTRMSMTAEELAAAQKRLKQAAIAAMPLPLDPAVIVVAEDTTTSPGWAKGGNVPRITPEEMVDLKKKLLSSGYKTTDGEEFTLGNDTVVFPSDSEAVFDAADAVWDPASGKDFTIRELFIDGEKVRDLERALAKEVRKLNELGKPQPWTREDMEESQSQWPSPSDRAVWPEKDDLSLSITDRVSGAIREVQNKTGTHPTKIVMGTKAWERFSKEQNITPYGPFSVELLGLPITVDDRVGDFLVGVKQQPSK